MLEVNVIGSAGTGPPCAAPRPLWYWVELHDPRHPRRARPVRAQPRHVPLGSGEWPGTTPQAGTVNLSNPMAIFAGSRPRFTSSRVTYEAYVVSRTSTRPQVDSDGWTVIEHPDEILFCIGHRGLDIDPNPASASTRPRSVAPHCNTINRRKVNSASPGFWDSSSACPSSTIRRTGPRRPPGIDPLWRGNVGRRCRRPNAVWLRATVPVHRVGWAAGAQGTMLWLPRKRLCGSTRRLTATSRSRLRR